MDIYEETDQLKNAIQSLIDDYKARVGPSVILDVVVINHDASVFGDARPKFVASVNVDASIPSVR
ncbi:hypothetical protein ACMG4M_05325 [Alcanivorax sp. IL3]|uniref:hypothetical protein n=1 Tax=unclassified Alcanivorax TaxID=2638842 RepID=UPI0039C12B7B